MAQGEMRIGAGVLLLSAATIGACTRSTPRESASAPPPVAAQAAPATEASAPPAASAAAESTAGGFDAIARQKFSDQEYMAAIAELESGNAAADAAADRAAGRQRVLAFPAQQGGKIPGFSGTRAQLPASVEIVRIAGIVEGTSNRHALRFEMLATRYAQEYNATMVRSLR